MKTNDTIVVNEYRKQTRLKKYLDGVTRGKKVHGNHIVLHRNVQKFDVNDSGYAIERNGVITFYGHDGSRKKFDNIGIPAACIPSWHLRDTSIHFANGNKRILIRLKDRKKLEVEIPEGAKSTCSEGGIIVYDYMKDGTLDEWVNLYSFDYPTGRELYKGRLRSWNVGPSYIALQLDAKVRLDEFDFDSTFSVHAARIIPFSQTEKQRIVRLGVHTQFFICGTNFIVCLDRSKGVSHLAVLIPIAHGYNRNECEAKLFDNWRLHGTKFGVCSEDGKIMYTLNLMGFPGEGYKSFSIKNIEFDRKHGLPKMNDLGYYQLVEGQLRLYPFTYEWYDFGLERIRRVRKGSRSRSKVLQD